MQDFMEQLNILADKVEDTLGRHGFSCRITGGAVDTDVIRLFMAAQVGTKVSKVSALASVIAETIHAPYVRIYRQGSRIVIEVPNYYPTGQGSVGGHGHLESSAQHSHGQPDTPSYHEVRHLAKQTSRANITAATSKTDFKPLEAPER